MLVELRRFGCFENVFGPGDFSGSPMGYEKILVHFDGGFVSQNAVFRYPDAAKSSPKNAHAADDNRTLQCGNDGSRYGARYEEWANTRHPEKRRAKQQAPEPAPQCAHFSPILHPLSGVVIA